MALLKEFYNVNELNWPTRLISQTANKKNHKETDSELKIEWLAHELVSSYNFPEAWIGSRIVYAEWNGNAKNNLYKGIQILTKDADPFIVLLFKGDSSLEADLEFLRTVMETDVYMQLGVLSDGSVKGTNFYRYNRNKSEFEYIPDMPSFINPERIGSPKPYGNIKNKPKKHTDDFRELESLTPNLEDLFFEAHSHIRDIDGLHQDEALDEMCKLMYAKMYDEETTESNRPYNIQRLIYGTIDECAAAVKRIYFDANEYDTRVFALKVPGYKRSRGVFNSQIRLSSSALVKVVETIQNYSITVSSADVKGRAFQKILAAATRSGMGQYFTPNEVVRLIVECIEPSVKDLILDPFAGSAHFLTQSLDIVKQKSVEADTKSLHEFAFNKLHGIEKSERMVRIAMTDMRLHGDGHSNIRCTDALLDMQNYPDLQPESFDIVMTNPPFGSLLGHESINNLPSFELNPDKKTIPLEILGLERSVQFLRPGGRIAIVLPEGIYSNVNTKYVRKWLLENVKIFSIISLPIETFSPFGANIKTSVLIARKWKKGEIKERDYKLMMCKIENIGYDGSGRTRGGGDVPKVIDALKTFKTERGW